MKLSPTDLPEVVLLEPQRFADDRGWFMETFHEVRFEAALAERGLPPAGRFVQENLSCSRLGVLRGLHYQLPPQAQGKLVRVVAGTAWDVAVDIRRGSPRFGRWAAAELSASNGRALWIPPGFAHGFLALADDTQVLYSTTTHYAPGCERAIRWDDPELGIAWPLAAGARPRLAAKDVVAPGLAGAELFEMA